MEKRIHQPTEGDMSEKTLGQVYREGCDEARRLFPSSPYDRESYAHAALIRAVLAERDKATEFVLRAMQIPRAIAAARQEMEREPPKPEAASEAGDWARAEIDRVAGKEFTRAELAQGFREAADRHYAKQIDMLKAVISAGKESSRVEHAKRLADRLDEASQRVTQLQGYLIALADEVGASYPSPMTDATFAANIMAATIKTVQERDAAVAEVAKRPDERSCLGALMKISELLGIGGIVNPGDTVKAVEVMNGERDAWKANYESMVDERDRNAAELLEMKFACEWSWSYLTPRTWFANTADAILAAFRATKGKEHGDGK